MMRAKMSADLAGADHADRLAMQVETHQAIQVEIAVARAHAGAGDLAVHRQQQADREFRHRMRRIIGDAHHGDAKPLRQPPYRSGCSRWTAWRPAGALPGQDLQHLGIDVSLTNTHTAWHPVGQRRVIAVRRSSRNRSSWPASPLARTSIVLS
jgi:hypothetical protein